LPPRSSLGFSRRVNRCSSTSGTPAASRSALAAFARYSCAANGRSANSAAPLRGRQPEHRSKNNVSTGIPRCVGQNHRRHVAHRATAATSQLPTPQPDAMCALCHCHAAGTWAKRKRKEPSWCPRLRMRTNRWNTSAHAMARAGTAGQLSADLAVADDRGVSARGRSARRQDLRSTSPVDPTAPAEVRA
jgi:hypothetical protein